MTSPRYFTHYWKIETWRRNQKNHESSEEDGSTSHTAGNGFRAKGVKPGDFVYLVTNDSGRLLVGACLEVIRFMTQKEADKHYENGAWEASDHVLARPRAPMQFELEVPYATARKLTFEPDGKSLVFHRRKIDQQTLRGIRELTPDGAHLLDGVLSGDLEDLELVDSELQIAENLETFAREANLHADLTRSLCSSTTYWVRDPVTKSFGPGKFVGFRNMTFARYREASAGNLGGKRFDGHLTQRAIQSCIGQPYAANADYASELESWASGRMGVPLDDVDRSKWRFVDLTKVSAAPLPAEELGEPEYHEGRATQSLRTSRERNPEARRRCIDIHGAKCSVCQIEMHLVYGDIGRGYIHVHHVKPLASAETSRTVDAAKDLVPVCPNCHAMLHQRTPPLEIEQLRNLVEERRSPRNQTHPSSDVQLLKRLLSYSTPPVERTPRRGRRSKIVLSGSELNGSDESIAGWAGLEVPEEKWNDYVDLVGGVAPLSRFFENIENGSFEVTEREEDMAPGMNDTYWEVEAEDVEALRSEIRERLMKELGLKPAAPR